MPATYFDTMAALADPTMELSREDPDAQIVRSLAAGDPDAPARLAERFERPLRSFLIRHVGDDPQLVDELVQDVLLAAWKGAGRFDGRARVSTWVFSIAHRQAISALRRRRPPTEPLSERLRAPADPSIDEHDDLHRALAELPEGQRAVIELTFIFGFSYREIAAILEIPEGTVKSRASVARSSLRDALEPEGRGR